MVTRMIVGKNPPPVQRHSMPHGDVRTIRRLLDAGVPVTYSALAAAFEEGFDAVVQLIN